MTTVSRFRPVALAHASHLISHGPTVMVASREGARRNLMSAAWLACWLIPEPHAQSAYDTCFAEVVAAAADACVFANGRWSFTPDNTSLHTLHDLGGGQFVAAGDAFSVQGGPV